MLGVQHEAAGGVIGLIFSFWLWSQYSSNQFAPLLILGCFLISIWGANLPDILDPPTNPFHRSVGHNVVSFFLFLLVALISLSLSIIFHWWVFILTSAFAFSVLSHLFLDMLTPMGLPMFVGKSILNLIEIPLFLIPIINIILLIISVISGILSIKYLAKKIGGVLALILVFIPVWGALFILGISLLTIHGTALGFKLLNWVGVLLLLIFVVLLGLLIGFGILIDRSIKKKNLRSKKVKKK
jgi:hypothetical protein